MDCYVSIYKFDRISYPCLYGNLSFCGFRPLFYDGTDLSIGLITNSSFWAISNKTIHRYNFLGFYEMNFVSRHKRMTRSLKHEQSHKLAVALVTLFSK